MESYLYDKVNSRTAGKRVRTDSYVMSTSSPKNPPTRKSGPDESNGKFRNKILRLSSVSEQNGITNTLPDDDTRASIGDLQNPRETIENLKSELNRRQESYVRRERQYRIRIDELQRQISDGKPSRYQVSSIDSTMDQLRTMHHRILENVGQVQDRTSIILQDQEKDLLRAFRARLYSVQEELETEKSKGGDGASAWIEKTKQLETELEWTKELADRLDRLNQSLTKENQRLKTQYTCQENDREFLVTQLVAAKKDNARLRSDLTALQEQLENDPTDGRTDRSVYAKPTSASVSSLPDVRSSPAPSLRPTTAGVKPLTAPINQESDGRYKDVINRLKRLLETERRSLQHARVAYKNEIQNRTELEKLIKECVQDVRKEVAQQQALLQLPTVSSSRHKQDGEAKRMELPDRQKFIEALLAKERLLELLSSRAFPVHSGRDPLLTRVAFSQDEVGRVVASATKFSSADRSHEVTM